MLTSKRKIKPQSGYLKCLPTESGKKAREGVKEREKRGQKKRGQGRGAPEGREGGREEKGGEERWGRDESRILQRSSAPCWAEVMLHLASRKNVQAEV